MPTASEIRSAEICVSAILLVVFLVQRTMMSVDIEELERLRYNFKGA